jgi:hypothetical protein
MAKTQRIVAAIAAGVSFTFLVLRALAEIAAIVHLPKDLEDAVVELSHVSSVATWTIAGIGLFAVGYLLHDLWRQYCPKKTAVSALHLAHQLRRQREQNHSPGFKSFLMKMTPVALGTNPICTEALNAGTIPSA